jgi:hypothetical protein
LKAPIIQGFVEQVGGPDYLEIGIEEGHNFRAITAENKMGVDPYPKFWEGRIYQMTSDEFFKTKRTLDGVIFVDGLHTYEQALRDIENSARCMTDRSIILVHDCMPGSPEEEQKEPASPGAAWCGDVWKAIAHIRATRNDLAVQTISIPYGLGVIRKGIPDSMLQLDVKKIKDLSYDFFVENKNDILNIKEN